ncbi:MAG: glycine betaine ABC transporter substrate-binding protein [Anaerolineae bacterium]
MAQKASKIDRTLVMQEAYWVAKDTFRKSYQLDWLLPFGFHNSYVLLMRKDQAEQHRIENISDLLKHEEFFKVGFDPEFFSRPECQSLKSCYRFSSKFKPFLMDQALLYLTLASANVDVISGSSTDSAVYGEGLKILVDDKDVFPPYECAPLVRSAALQAYPELQRILEFLAGRITEEKMRKMNYEVEKKGRNIYQVALDFLSFQN